MSILLCSRNLKKERYEYTLVFEKPEEGEI